MPGSMSYCPIFDYYLILQEMMREFLLCLALCHTVHVNKDQGDDGTDSPDGMNAATDYTLWEYEASSPDEKALVDAARRLVIA